MVDKNKQLIWKFIRGDLTTDYFEKWAYENKELEEIVDEEFYLEIVSTNYQSKPQVFELKQKLEVKLRQTNNLTCQCITLADTAIIDMGSEQDERVFATLEEIKSFGEPLWWLVLYNCKNCQQYWLVAQEERQNDIYCFKRLTSDEGTQIIDNNNWPKYFRTYEELLILGRDSGHSVRFADPLNSSPLIDIATDLARNRPGISTGEIESLLNLDPELAVEICKRAVSREGVNISFPA